MSSPERAALSTPLSANPFPPAAVARFDQLGLQTESPTVPTRAIRETESYVDEYLAATGEDQPRQDRGMVLAVVGEYGTGKTHLASFAVNRLRGRLQGDIRPLYLDAPDADMLTLYRERFMPRLSASEIGARVLEFYSDVVADELSGSELTAPLATGLRAGEVAADSLVRNLGLMGSDLMRRLQARLKVVTEREDFASALALYTRPEFRDAVWEWFRGGRPDASLTERGVTTSIETEEDALAAIGVFALLFSGQHKRFVVVFDEMEKIISASSAGDRAERLAFGLRRLFQIANQTNSLFVLCGLPDFLDSLPEDVQQRISAVLRPGPLTASDTEEYVRAVMRNSTGQARTDPFHPDSIDYLTELSGGNARRVVRLCYLTYQRACQTGTEVTRPLIREVAREQFELVPRDDVRNDIGRVLTRSGWRFEREFLVKWRQGRSRRDSRVDFWLPLGDKGAGCGIIISQSILQDHELDEALGRAQVFSQTTPQTPRVGLLVVNGYLSEALRKRVEQQYAGVVTWSQHRFSEELTDTVHGLLARIDASARQATLARVNEQLDQVVRQNLSLRAAVDQLTVQATSSDALARAAEVGLRRIFGQLSGGQADDFPARFPKTRLVFDNITRRLDLMVDPIDRIFGPGRLGKRSAPPLVVQLSGSSDMLMGAAHAVLLRKLVLAFRQSIVDHLATNPVYESQEVLEGVAELSRLMETVVASSTLHTASTALERWSVATGTGPDDRPIIDVVRQLGANIHHAVMRDLDNLSSSA